MKIKANNKTLSGLLNKIHSIPAGSREGLCAMRLECGIEGVWITKSSSICKVKVRVEAEIDEDDDAGDLYLNADNFSAVADKFNRDLEIEYKEGAKAMSVRAGSGKASLTAIDSSGLAPEYSPDESGKMSQIVLLISDLVECLQTALPFASKQDSEPFLKSVCLRTCEDGKSLTFAATDRRRLICVPLSGEFDRVDAIISSDVASSIVKILSGLDGGVTISFNPQCIKLQHPEIELIYSLIDVCYPPYQKIVEAQVNDEDDAVAVVKKETLLKAIQIVAPFGSSLDQKIIEIRFSNDAIELIGDNKTDAVITQKIDARCKKSPSKFINSNFFTDIIKSFKEADLELKFKSRSLVMTEGEIQAFTSIINPKS